MDVAGRDVMCITTEASNVNEVCTVASPDLTNAESVPQEPAEQVTYETLDEGRIARIWLNRPNAQNAQSRTLLVQLDEAFGRAEADDTVRVVILAGRGKNFSAGHDLGSEEALLERKPGPAQHPTFRSHGSTMSGIAETNVSPGMALLLREHPQVAGFAQDHHRAGPGQCHLGGVDADLGVRPDRRGR